MPENSAIQPEVPPLNINPCIFVGIGTTGLRILEALRRLFYEEFGVAGLPCFRYIVLETDRNSEPKDGFLPHPPGDGERINLIPMTIPDLEAVRRSPELCDWLDERTLKCNQRAIQAGAGHRRQTGRLCLWENWPSVKDAINQAVQEVNTPEARTMANRFLREKYFARRQLSLPLPEESLVDPVPRVYLCGTLCGGTCSGIFLDVAFFFQSLLHVRSRSNLKDTGSSEIIGLFTIPDTFYLQHEQSLPHVVSCWAALSELDYYSKDDTTYELRFPNQERYSTREPPFTTAYLVSNRHMGRAGFTEDDADSLPQMCAMNLFTEVVAGMAVVKAANRVNLPTTDENFFKVNSRGYIHAFSSFGLSAIWYPRYRVAKAICRRLAEEMITDWLGHDGFQPQKVEETLRADWQAVLDWASGNLLGTVPKAHCPVHLPQVVQQLFDRRWPEFLAASREGLEGCILDFPGGDTTLGQRLSPGGEYYRHMETAATLLTPELRKRLRGLVVRYLRQHSVAETRHYVMTLETWVKAKEESIPAELPAYTQQQNLSRAAEVYEDRSVWALGQRRAAIEEFKKEVWSRFRESTRQHLDRLRDLFLKQILTSVRGDLANLRQELEAASTALTILRNTCIREREELVKCPHASNIVILSAGASNTIADDVEQGVAAVLRSMSLEQLRAAFLRREEAAGAETPEEPDPLELCGRRQDSLMGLIERGYERVVQEQATRFQIGQEAIRAATAHIQNLVHFSAPYFEPSPEWQRLKTSQPPNFLFCSRPETARELADRANQHLAGTRFDCKISPLDHFVFFYQEIPGLALSDFAIAPFAAERLEAEEAKPDNPEPTRYTHRMGRRRFDEKAILDEARLWLRDTSELAPELFQSLGNQRFLTYRPAENQPSRDLYVDDENSLRSFIRENGLEALIRLLAERLATVDRAELVHRMEQRKSRAKTRQEREALTKRHEEMLKTVFPT